jgi:hypothetical protein
MNGTQSPDAQKALNANSNGSNSNNSSLAAKKRKKDLKPIITMEGTNQTEEYVASHLLVRLVVSCSCPVFDQFCTIFITFHPVMILANAHERWMYHGHELFSSINWTAGTQAALHTQEISKRW